MFPVRTSGARTLSPEVNTSITAMPASASSGIAVASASSSREETTALTPASARPAISADRSAPVSGATIRSRIATSWPNRPSKEALRSIIA